MKPQSRAKYDFSPLDLHDLFAIEEDENADPDYRAAAIAEGNRRSAESRRRLAEREAAEAAVKAAEEARLRRLASDKEGLQYDPEIADELLEHIRRRRPQGHLREARPFPVAAAGATVVAIQQ
jgi:hypothetical protein